MTVLYVPPLYLHRPYWVVNCLPVLGWIVVELIYDLPFLQSNCYPATNISSLIRRCGLLDNIQTEPGEIKFKRRDSFSSHTWIGWWRWGVSYIIYKMEDLDLTKVKIKINGTETKLLSRAYNPGFLLINNLLGELVSSSLVLIITK